MVLPGHAEQLVLRAVTELGLPEPARPGGQLGRVTGGVGVPREDLPRAGGGREPVVDLARLARLPAGGVLGELDPADGGRVPQHSVAAVGEDERDAHLAVALNQVQGQALQVQPAVGPLPEAVEALARVGRELLVNLVRTGPVTGEDPRARHPEVLAALRQQLLPGRAAEGDQRLGVARGGVERDLDPEPAVDQGRARPVNGDVAGGGDGRVLGERADAVGRYPVPGRAHPHAVGAPGLNADHLVPVPHLEDAVVVAIADHAR